MRFEITEVALRNPKNLCAPPAAPHSEVCIPRSQSAVTAMVAATERRSRFPTRRTVLRSSHSDHSGIAGIGMRFDNHLLRSTEVCRRAKQAWRPSRQPATSLVLYSTTHTRHTNDALHHSCAIMRTRESCRQPKVPQGCCHLCTQHAAAQRHVACRQPSRMSLELSD